MTWLGDATLAHLRELMDAPDLTGTRYALVGRLGRGGMGSVFKVRDTALDREVALKVLSTAASGDALAARLRQEAHILSRLEHPNIVPVHDVGTLADGRPFYTMRCVQGQRLDAWLRSGHPSRPAVLRLFIKVCEAVAFAHARGILHRDLKPQNVMVGAFGEALVMDWGLAKALGAHPQEAGAPAPFPPPPPVGPEGADTAQGAVLGTPAYMSPEQARGEVAALDVRTDVYALGAILHFLLLGVAPPPVLPPGARLPMLPKPLAAICRKALAVRPEERYPTAEALAADVGCFLDGLPVTAHREGPLEVTTRLLARHRTLASLVLAYLAMRLVLLFVTGR